MRQGEIGDCMFAIQAGTLEVLKQDQKTEVRVALLQPGDIFGEMAIFDQSWYIRVLQERVEGLVPERQWRAAFRDIIDFERMMADNGTQIIKFFLHISKEEQAERLRARLEDKRKNWKFDRADVAERALWKDYQRAYEDCLGATSAKIAPWYIVPEINPVSQNLSSSAAIVCSSLTISSGLRPVLGIDEKASNRFL